VPRGGPRRCLNFSNRSRRRSESSRSRPFPFPRDTRARDSAVSRGLFIRAERREREGELSISDSSLWVGPIARAGSAACGARGGRGRGRGRGRRGFQRGGYLPAAVRPRTRRDYETAARVASPHRTRDLVPLGAPLYEARTRTEELGPTASGKCAYGITGK